MNGTYGFVYSGFIGVGIGVFTIRASVLTGADGAGGKYDGRVVNDPTTGGLIVDFDMFVPAGTFLVQGTSPLDFNSTRNNLSISWPSNFADGVPIEVYIPPGPVTLMIRRISDEEYSALASGFRLSVVLSLTGEAWAQSVQTGAKLRADRAIFDRAGQTGPNGPSIPAD